jgi:dTDP-glucose 4,6-dehydratase
MQRQPDITLAKKLLKWQPKVDRATGLKITYAYFKSLSAKELHEKDHNSFEGYVRK